MKILALFVLCPLLAHAANWPNWRGGVDGSGITSETGLPLKWSATDKVLWKIPLPDRGNSTPVIWEGKIFLTQALEKEKLRSTWCLSAKDGSVLWKKDVPAPTNEPTHGTNSYCSASPSTDGERIIVYHGSAGVYCYDLDGKELWKRDLGPMSYEWGNGSSPVLHGDRCYLYHGPGEKARLVALDKKTGEVLWSYDEPAINTEGRTDGFRGNANGMVCTYATPTVYKTAAGKEELIMLFPGVMRSFDPATGKVLWHCDGMNPLVYTSAISGEGVHVGMGGFQGTTIAVPTEGKLGDRTPERLYQTARTKNRLGSGVIHEGHFYVLNTEGFMECVELKTGKQVYFERLKPAGPKGESWSSIVRGGDRLYILNQSGDCYVLRAAPKFELLATNALGSELTNSSLAVSNGRLYIRTHQNLWAIGETK